MPNLDPKLYPTIPTNNYVHMDRKAQKIWIKDPKGNILSENFAVSGNPGSMDPKHEKEKGVGPIPAGEYTFRPKGRIDHKKETWQAMKDFNPLNWIGPSWLHTGRPGGEVAWGPYHWDITPKNGTETWGRDGFTIHGGWGPGSAGCIDLANPGELMSTKDILFNYWNNADWEGKLKLPFQLLNNKEEEMNPGANKNLESFRKNVEKYLGDQDEVLLRVSKFLKSNPNMMQQMNTKKVAAEGIGNLHAETLKALVENSKIKEEAQARVNSYMNKVQAGAKDFSYTQTRNFFNNLSLYDKLMVMFSRIFGFKNENLEKFETQQRKLTSEWVNNRIHTDRDTYDKKYGKGAFVNQIIRGTPEMQDYLDNLKMTDEASTNKGNSKTNSDGSDNVWTGVDRWFGNTLADQAQKTINKTIDTEFEAKRNSWFGKSNQQQTQPNQAQTQVNQQQQVTTTPSNQGQTSRNAVTRSSQSNQQQQGTATTTMNQAQNPENLVDMTAGQAKQRLTSFYQNVYSMRNVSNKTRREKIPGYAKTQDYYARVRPYVTWLPQWIKRPIRKHIINPTKNKLYDFVDDVGTKNVISSKFTDENVGELQSLSGIVDRFQKF